MDAEDLVSGGVSRTSTVVGPAQADALNFEAVSLCPHEENGASVDRGHAGASAGVLGVGQHGG